ncbi:MAG TPA: non-heme iron oxygenase ferredoxin subunit [Candidatus Dormibacteraeota bacterium]|nr:non-heme iron oxygenase ferredoxin subunit [Candidatus Dormibacteraeota bacterium]
MAKVRVASVDEVPIETLKAVLVDHQEICLAHADDGNFYAIDDVCTHENFLLSGGELFGLDVECPQHGSRFNLQTGKVTGLPAVIPTKVYPVEVEGDEVYVEVGSSPPPDLPLGGGGH